MKKIAYSKELMDCLISEQSEVNLCPEDVNTEIDIICEGRARFRVDYDDSESSRYTINWAKECNPVTLHYDRRAYSVMTGQQFLKDVRGGTLADYDGEFYCVLVDGRVSNLGLCENGLCQGGFLVIGEIFEDICSFSEVYVLWSNK